MTENKTFSIKEDGFFGILFKSEKEICPNKALLLCTGSDGNIDSLKNFSQRFCDSGITVLGIGFYKVPDGSDTICEIPLEYAEKAGNYLKSIGYEKIAFYSISMGSVYALLSGSYFPELFGLVVVSAPLNYVYQAVSPDKRRLIDEKSAFSYKGKPIPYEPNVNKMSMRNFIIDSFKKGDVSNAYLYESLVTTAKEEHLIPVEKMKAHIILFTGKMDYYWPSYASAEMIMKRLKEHNYTYPYEHISFEHGGHLLAPVEITGLLTKFFKATRKYPEENEQYRKEILEKIIESFKTF
ncbi:hypothetical protein PIROE2DRAFT_58101 [Piromyces sp. E2]|nr:hypothetical protein PIROE2DRAFT_58101 [Piromyces sp. E2]|eukprot:OUM68455.1 hypothetical protein PIROE2DRAFT_58101 [Piromyces sp. E2]